MLNKLTIRTIALTFTLILILSLFSLVYINSASSLNGNDFKKDRIIDDAIFFNGNTMTVSQIQQFLNSKVPTCDTNGSEMHSSGQTRAAYGTSVGYPPPYTCLKDFKQSYQAQSDSGLCSYIAPASGRTAAQIIDTVANACNVNEKALIVTLQKEQSLITDEWPWAIQYDKAMGYYCPDDPTRPGWCHPDYAGFFKQVYNAAKQFNRYKQYPDEFNHAHKRTSFVAYQENAPECGGTNINMTTAATAGLYNYTPYQPNAAALQNLYDTGDSCSAYGNRNFWRMFNDWFGTTLVAAQWMQPEGSNTQYVVYDGKKQAISSPDARAARNIDSLPLEIWTAERANNTPTHNFGNLTRKVQRVGTNNYYYADNDKRYLANSHRVRAQWNISDSTTFVTPTLMALTEYAGNLSAYVTDESATIYFVDDEVLRPIASPTVLHALRRTEHIASMSSNLLQTKMTTGPTLQHNRLSNGTSQYLISDGGRYTIPNDLLASYPHTAALVSNDTISYFNDAGTMGRFVKSSAGGGVFIVDGGLRNGLPNLDIFNTYYNPNGTYAYITKLGPRAFSLIDSGENWRSALISNQGNYYVMSNGRRHAIPTNLIDNYGAPSKFQPVSNGLITAYPSGSAATPYITSRENRAVFMLADGSRYGISNPTTLRQLLKPSESITTLLNYDLQNYTYQHNLTNYFSNTTSNYFVDQGTRYPTSQNMAKEWGLENKHLTTVSSNALDHFTLSTENLTNYALISGKRSLITSGNKYEVNNTYGQLWGINTNNYLPLSGYSMFRVDQKGKLDRFAAKSGAIYTIDGGELIGIGNIHTLFNIGYTNQPIVTLSNETFNLFFGSKPVFRGYLVKDSASTCYVIDGGIKRLPNTNVQDEWCFGVNTALTLSDSYLGLLGDGTNLSKSLRASGDNTLYAIDDGTKRWIPSNNIYNTYFSPFTPVSKHLRNVLPNGPKVGSSGL